MSGPALASANPTTTPILDRVIPLPTRPKPTRKATALQMTVGAVIGGGLCYTIISSTSNLGPFFPLIFIFNLYASIYLGIIIHEVGHLLAGILSGYRVNFIRVGPIQINPPFRLSRPPKLGIGAAGMASVLPGKTQNAHARAVLMYLGGPLANLISAGCVWLLLSKPLSPFAAWFAGVSLFLGIVNLMPFVRMGAVYDGRRMLTILRKTPQGERCLAIMQLCTALWDGVLPEKLDQEMLKKATAVIDNWPDTVAGYSLAFSAAFDQHNDIEAARLLETALQYSPFTTFAGKEGMLVEAAIFQAKRRGRIDLAEQWLAEVPQKPLTPGVRCLAEAAILEARNEPEAALAKLNESEQAISRMPAGFERDIMLSSLARRKSKIGTQQAVPMLV
jgi:hypothetical protein